MKKISKIFTVCCFVSSIIAHTQEKLDCNLNYKEAISYIQLSQNFKKDSLKVMRLIEPCLQKGDDKAQLLMGRLHAVKGDEKSYEKAFKLLKKSAKQGNAMAMVDLGLMYKYGNGCKLNFNKARRWFKKAAELDNDKAAYCLGYLFLKGFGNIDQDYTKAVQWFQKSNYPMAKYWLGVCYYYGYGVQKNINEANILLGTNFGVEESNIVTTDNSDKTTENTSEQIKIDFEDNEDSEEIAENTLLGKWTGSLLQYDWSGEHIEQKQSISVEFKYDSISEVNTYSLEINETVISGLLNKIDNVFYFENLEVNLPHTSFHKRIPNKLDYHLLSCDMSLKELETTNFLVGDFDNYIEKWSESGAPLRFVLKKKETFANSDEEISNEILSALASQKEKFIKLYPNPFKNDLIISYTLEKPGFVVVTIADINGTKNILIEQGKQQKEGEHNYFFDGTSLEKGIYIVTVIVNNQRKTRIIVKK